MLGFPLLSWLRFFAGGFVAGILMFLVPYPPMSALGAFEMVVAGAGSILVATYGHCYEPFAWRRLLVRLRRLRNAIGGAAVSAVDAARRRRSSVESRKQQAAPSGL